MLRNTEELSSLLAMLEVACEAVAEEIGRWLKECAQQEQKPLPDTCIQLCESQLHAYLKGAIRLSKTRVLEAVRLGKRALVFVLDADPASGSLLPLAADAAGISDLAERLASRKGFVKLYNGYVMLHEGGSKRVLFPPIGPICAAVEQALLKATKTPSGLYVVAHTRDGLARATLQVGYPAYYVYELEQCAVMGGPWHSVERTGRDQLVALLAHAYHHNHWFARDEDVVWTVR
jgi:hypothetical protein